MPVIVELYNRFYIRVITFCDFIYVLIGMGVVHLAFIVLFCNIGSICNSISYLMNDAVENDNKR